MAERFLKQELILKGRSFTKGYSENDPYRGMFESDQAMNLPMPSLTKMPMTGNDKRIKLTMDFSSLSLNMDVAELFYRRKSSRFFTGEKMSFEQLSFLLWSTQGVKAVRGKNYATIRTVPSGGARHEFETYLVVMNVAGLAQGIYHYLPMEHAVELINSCPNDDTVTQMLCGQRWGAKANVVFFWSMVPYRAEWRYGIYAHRPALIDVGHVGQNLYLAATALGIGTCAIAAFSNELCNRVLSLDGEDEYVVYCAPVGTIAPDKAAQEERETYAFVYDEE